MGSNFGRIPDPLIIKLLILSQEDDEEESVPEDGVDPVGVSLALRLAFLFGLEAIDGARAA